MTDKSLSAARAKAGRKGGKATGPQKSWILKLTPEERSEKMRALAKKRYQKNG